MAGARQDIHSFRDEIHNYILPGICSGAASLRTSG
jgi:hypothetical protein